MVATSLLISQLVGLGVQDIERLQYAVVLVGISYGALFGLTPIIVIEWFGIGPYTFYCWKIVRGTNMPFGYPPSPSTVAQPTSQRTVVFLTSLCL
jgi:hypothetical protein